VGPRAGRAALTWRQALLPISRRVPPPALPEPPAWRLRSARRVSVALPWRGDAARQRQAQRRGPAAAVGKQTRGARQRSAAEPPIAGPRLKRLPERFGGVAQPRLARPRGSASQAAAQQAWALAPQQRAALLPRARLHGHSPALRQADEGWGTASEFWAMPRQGR